ncbi:class I adenylate-forming enzyme family protein [Hoeflea poritis]|uniref:AMP-binding protein n=1 Tax=Hoeflea poritis TaxID=2993659 RepID=A0ABT4VI88_9HYPH|nr:AMP-binding protein [Hoeflea poritis]MDA4844429.1 AMP-binding protein [Hoeflea poritis]
MMYEPSALSGRSTVYGLFRARARVAPDMPALRQRDIEISYGALLSRTNRLANGLRGNGIGRGDRIAILSRNRTEYIELELAAAAIGTIVCCLNWRLVEDELAHCISLVEPSLIIAEEALASGLPGDGGAPVLKLGKPYEALLAGSSSTDVEGDVEPEDGLIILYTSGTTGLPKGAVISHRAMIARSLVFSSEWALAPDDGFVAWAPLFHMASTDHALSTLMRGGLVSIVDGYNADEIIAAIERHKIGWLVLIPGMIEDFIAAGKAAGVKPVGIVICGAMADLVPPQQIAEVTRILDTPYANSFGATETGLAPASRGKIQPGEFPESLSKQQTAFCEVRLVDPDDKDVADGEPGELALRGPTLFSGYWNADAANAECFRGGWFHMGDVFRRNPDGTLDFVDRAKYLIKTGGENVYPAEIERVLLADPGVSDAAVVRTGHEKWGEVPVAFVSVSDETLTEEALLQRCSQSLARYKRPSRIRFIAFDDFPRSTSGKIQRHLLEQMIDE